MTTPDTNSHSTPARKPWPRGLLLLMLGGLVSFGAAPVIIAAAENGGGPVWLPFVFEGVGLALLGLGYRRLHKPRSPHSSR
jgi:hypothetical protein